MPSRRKCDRPRFTAGRFVAIDGTPGLFCARVRCRVEGAGPVRGSLGAQVLQRWHVGVPSPDATESAHVSLHQHRLRDAARTVEPRSGERHQPLTEEAAGHSRQRRAQDREAWQRRGLPLGPARPLQKDRWVSHGSGTQLRRARSLEPRLASPAEGDVGCNVGPARAAMRYEQDPRRGYRVGGTWVAPTGAPGLVWTDPSAANALSGEGAPSAQSCSRGA